MWCISTSAKWRPPVAVRFPPAPGNARGTCGASRRGRKSKWSRKQSGGNHPPLEGEGRIAEGDPGWGDAGAPFAERSMLRCRHPTPLASRATLPLQGRVNNALPDWALVNNEGSMPQPSPSDLARSGTLEELYGKLDKIGMGPGWNKPTPSLWPAPRKTLVPAHWQYELARGALDAAGRLINTALAERRNLILVNPAEGNTYGTVRTLVAAYQMIMPGEWARAHRHTPNALRLILDAEPGTYTQVDGVNIAIAPGDVLLTPNWSAHGHGNRSKACAYWLDFLDVPLVQLLEPMFFEAAEDDSNGADDSGRAPAEAATDQRFVFTLADTLRRLSEANPEPGGPFGTQIELGHPALAHRTLHDAACSQRSHRALSHHGKQYLRGGAGRRGIHGRRRAVRMAARRCHRGPRLASPL